MSLDRVSLTFSQRILAPRPNLNRNEIATYIKGKKTEK